jgi:hypothetical protein
MEVSLGHFDGPREGMLTGDAQHHGDLSDAMLEVGIAANGETNDLGSAMMMAVLFDGELTPVWHSKRNADMVDVDSFERAERRVVVKNLE